MKKIKHCIICQRIITQDQPQVPISVFGCNVVFESHQACYELQQCKITFTKKSEVRKKWDFRTMKLKEEKK